MSAIPKLSPADILGALMHIDREGVPPRRRAKHFHLAKGGRLYPPKLVVSLATAIATGATLPANDFSGGAETNAALTALGFDIVDSRVTSGKPPAAEKTQAKTRTAARTPIARIVVNGRASGTAATARKILLSAFRSWNPNECQAKFTITPGGFVKARMPVDWRGGIGWHATPIALRELSKVATPVVEQVLTDEVLEAARARTRILTIGADLWSSPSPSIYEPHIELVAVVDARSGRILRWTGKSYPVASQQHMLVHVADLKTHLIQLAGERVLILGCHDLNMLGHRAQANLRPGTFKHARTQEMVELVRAFDPTMVLQHPHSTDTPRTWSSAWGPVSSDYPSVRAWASAIGFHHGGQKPRGVLEDVLFGTRSKSGVVDFVVEAP